MQLLDKYTLMIILTNEDMQKSSIDLNKLIDNNFQYILEKLLLLAQIDLGFETKNSYLEIEVIECSDGAVVTIYKLPSRPKKLKLSKSNEKHSFRSQLSKGKSTLKSSQSKPQDSSVIIYEFKDTESLLLSLEQLKALEARKKISIFQSDIYGMDEKYYLISETVAKDENINRALLSEYGTFINSGMQHKICEYGTLLYGKRAVQDIGKIMGN